MKFVLSADRWSGPVRSRRPTAAVARRRSRRRLAPALRTGTARRRRHRVVPVERGSVAGSRGARARRGSPRAAARRRRRAARAGAGRRAGGSSPARRARARRRATAPRASRGAGISQRRAPAGGVAGRAPPARRARRARRGAPNTKHSRQRVRGQPVGAVQARARALADGVEARRPCVAPVEVGDDAAHHVVRRGGDRDELARRVEARRAQRVDDVREARRVDRAHVERRRRRRRSRAAGPDRARDLVARGELVDEALALRRRAASRPRRGSPR